MKNELSSKVQQIVDGRMGEWLVESAQDFDDALTGQVLVSAEGVDGAQNGWAHQLNFASGVSLVVDSDAFSDLSVDLTASPYGRRIAGTSMTSEPGFTTVAAAFDDGEELDLIIATGTGSVGVSGWMTRTDAS
jgi:hypothetical protein